jgi:hypothetical protein
MVTVKREHGSAERRSVTMRRLLAVLLLSLAAHPAGSIANSSPPLVGHIMALLSVFEEADALPTESSPEANSLIHALIQTQAALTKSTDPATRLWFSEALRMAQKPGGPTIPSDALSSRTLEAILTYAALHPPADSAEVLPGLRQFNVGQSDFDLMARVYRRAQSRLTSAGQDLHVLYEKERRAMPFR